MSYLLKQAFYHKNGRETLFRSESVTDQDVLVWRTFAPLALASDRPQGGIFGGKQGDFIVTQTHGPLSAYTVAPRALLTELGGNLAPLFPPLRKPDDPAASPPVHLEGMAWPAEQRLPAAQALIDRCGSLAHAFALLSAAGDPRGLWVMTPFATFEEQLAFVSGLMALLPPKLRPDLTFSTYDAAPSVPRVLLTDARVDTARHMVDFARGEESFPPMFSAYGAYWEGSGLDLPDLLDTIDTLDRYISQPSEKPLNEQLDALNARYTSDQLVLQDDTLLNADHLYDVLTSPNAPQGDLRRLYAQRLFPTALEERDAEMARAVAAVMDVDPTLDAQLSSTLTQALQTQPDAVYSFVRARLGSGVPDARWLTRLQGAARAALYVAITDGDSDTVVNWLMLILREPLNYHLEGVLRGGVQLARERAVQDSEIAKMLWITAIKRTPELVDDLLRDQPLLNALPDCPLSAALRAHDVEAIEGFLAQKGPAFYLVLLARAIHASAAFTVHAAAIERLWDWFATQQVPELPEAYQPITLLHQLAHSGGAWLSADALAMMCNQALAYQQDALFHQTLAALPQRAEPINDIEGMLADAIRRSRRNVSDILALVGQLHNDETLKPQQAVNLFVLLLNGWEWRKTAFPIAEQVARLAQQSAAINLDAAALWRMIEQGAEHKNELMMRVAAKRLMLISELLEDDAQLVENLARVHDYMLGNAFARHGLQAWWRKYTRMQTTAHLQRLEKALEGRRTLEDELEIVRTTLALRRMLGKRTWAELSEAFATTYEVLEALSDSFEPDARHAIHFDPDTVREELDAHESELTPQRRTIFAKNCKEIAQWIGSMGDNRSKASLVRRDPDRQLATGEHDPQSALDVLKWMAGYLEGAQSKANSEE
jgi:hypothetical protein